jgi:ferredoxin-NADP reductase
VSSATAATEQFAVRLEWQVAELVEKAPETARAATLVLRVPAWPGHRAGQHVDVRLTAEDGYRAERSYSVASAPEDAALSLTVERLENGEVSPYLVDELRPGDLIELRGPIGGWFTWSAGEGGPLLLVAGGSGLVPLMAMLRHRAAAGNEVPSHVLVSASAFEDVLFREELDALAVGDDALAAHITLTRRQPPGWAGFARRVDADMLADVGFPASTRPRVFVCGPTGFVEAVSSALVALGHDPATVKTERFGPTG